jgi:uncharacterized protein (TIGR00159 family)
LIKGTVAINIFIGIFVLYILWEVVRALEMKLLSSVLGAFTGLGVLALIIVFQPEARRFLLLIGTKYFGKNNLSIENFFTLQSVVKAKVNILEIVKACKSMANIKTGALIVIAKKSELRAFSDTGVLIDAQTSARLLESLFYKNNPLHDGAVIIVNDKIKAARCVLPVSESPDLDLHLGMRHRSALGMSEDTDSVVIVVSEQTGDISFFNAGKFEININPDQLKRRLEKEFVRIKAKRK